MKETRYILEESRVTDEIDHTGDQLEKLASKIRTQATLEGKYSKTMATLLQSLPDEGR